MVSSPGGVSVPQPAAAEKDGIDVIRSERNPAGPGPMEASAGDLRIDGRRRPRGRVRGDVQGLGRRGVSPRRVWAAPADLEVGMDPGQLASSECFECGIEQPRFQVCRCRHWEELELPVFYGVRELRAEFISHRGFGFLFGRPETQLILARRDPALFGGGSRSPGRVWQ